jgi:hypothetical protein
MKDKTNRKLLTFVYYSGHGLMDNLTFGINRIKEQIPIE